MLQLRPVSASRQGVMVMFPCVSVNTSASVAKMKSRSVTKSRQGVNSSKGPVIKKPTLSPVFPLSWKTEGTKEPIGNASTELFVISLMTMAALPTTHRSTTLVRTWRLPMCACRVPAGPVGPVLADTLEKSEAWFTTNSNRALASHLRHGRGVETQPVAQDLCRVFAEHRRRREARSLPIDAHRPGRHLEGPVYGMNHRLHDPALLERDVLVQLVRVQHRAGRNA